MPASVIERRLGDYQRQHAAYAGRQFLVLDVQLGIDGKLSVMAVRAEITGARQFGPTQSGQHMACP